MIDSFEFKMAIAFIIALGIAYIMEVFQKRKEKAAQAKFDLVMKSLENRRKNGR